MNYIEFKMNFVKINISNLKRMVRQDLIGISVIIILITFFSLSSFYFDYNKISIICIGAMMTVFIYSLVNLILNIQDLRIEKEYLIKLEDSEEKY